MINTDLPWLLCVAAGVTFTLASAAANLIYGLGRSTELPMQIVWGAVAVAASLALAMAPLALLRSRSIIGALLSIAAIVLFGVFSLSSTLGSFYGGRAASQAQQISDVSSRDRLERSFDAARFELSQLAPSRPITELETLVSTLKATPGANGCMTAPDGPISFRVCNEVSKVEAEIVRARQRAELAGAMGLAAEALANHPQPKIVNADALALSTFGTKLGVAVTPEALNPWLALLAVILVEFGGGVCFAVAGVFAASRTMTPELPAIAVIEPTAIAEATADKKISAETETSTIIALENPQNYADGFDAKGPAPDPANASITDRLFNMLARRGAELLGSSQTFAAALGITGDQAERALAELEAAGQVTVARGDRATVVRLASAA